MKCFCERCNMMVDYDTRSVVESFPVYLQRKSA